MPGPEILLWVVCLPAGVAALVTLVLAALPGWWRRRGAAAAGTVGVSAGYLTAHWSELGRPEIPPLEVVGWNCWFAAAAAALAVLEALSPSPARWRWPVRILLAAALPLCFLYPLGGSEGNSLPAVLPVAALGLGLFGWWTVLDRLGGGTAEVRGGAVLVATALAAGVAMLLSASLILAKLGAALGSSLGAAGVVALLIRRQALAGTAGVAATVLAALLLNSHLYVKLPATSGLLLVLAPVVGLGVSRALERKAGAFRAACAGLGAALLPLAGAVAIAWHHSAPFSESGG